MINQDPGYVRIYRKFRKDWKWKDRRTRDAWFWMILEANWADNVPVPGLRRGELKIEGLMELGMIAGWTERYQVKRFLERCQRKKDATVVQRKCNGGATIYLCDYDEYQPKCNASATVVQRECNSSEYSSKRKNKELKNNIASPDGERPVQSGKSADSRIKILLDFFFEKYWEIRGEKFHVLGGRDTAAIKRLLSTYPDVDELQRRIVLYLQDPLTFAKKPIWSITGFEKLVQKYSLGYEPEQVQESWEAAFEGA